MYGYFFCIVTIACLFTTGRFGDVYTDLACGNHTLDIRCISVRSGQELNFVTTNFMTSCPSKPKCCMFCLVLKV